MEIILIRHGKPTSAHNLKINAVGFAKWVKNYNSSDIPDNSRPVERIHGDINTYYIVSSNLKRAIHSAEIYTGKSPDRTLRILREMEIPRYKLPFQLKAWTWVYLNRALWMIGLKGSFESYKQARQRAQNAADELILLAKEKNKVIIFGHGYINLYIRKYLVKEGWRLHNKDNNFWGITALEI
jgi:broad specificity phosphatase PhoE